MKRLITVLAALTLLPVATALGAQPDSFCERKPEHPRCTSTPTFTPAPSLSPTPTSTPSPSSVATPPAPTPTPTAFVTAIPTSTAAPTPTASPSTAPSTTSTFESQSWWRRDGLNVPAQVGAHIHVRATVPKDGVPVDGLGTIPTVITAHELVGKLSWFRIGWVGASGSGYLVSQHSITLGPCADCSVSRTYTVDWSQVPTGRVEIRMSANNPDEDPTLSGAQRMFQSSGFQVCVRVCPTATNGVPSYRGLGIHVIARSWYEGHDYQNVERTSPIGSSVSGKFGQSESDTTFAGVYIDPNFHAGDDGIVVREWSGFWQDGFSATVPMPSLPAGPHTLVMTANDNQNGVVLADPFVVP